MYMYVTFMDKHVINNSEHMYTSMYLIHICTFSFVKGMIHEALYLSTFM